MEKSDDKNGLVATEVIDAEVIKVIEGNIFSRNRSKVIAGIVGVTIFIGGGVAMAQYKPFADTKVAVASTATPTTPDTTTDTPTTPPTPTVQAATTDFNGDNYPIPDDGKYHASVHNPAEIVLHGITFHEGFRAPGLKALDVWVLARSANNGENSLNGGTDEIVSATGTSGKVYNMVGSKGTGVTSNYHYKAYSEEQIVQYIDVDESEKGIVSVVLKHDGKLITLKPVKETIFDTTYGDKKPVKTATKSATTTTTPKATVTTPAKATPTPTTTPAIVADPKPTATNPPAELSQMPQGERYDSAYVRKLAAWITAHPTSRTYYHGLLNPTGETPVYNDITKLPIPPGQPGDLYDPAYLYAYADYHDYLIKAMSSK